MRIARYTALPADTGSGDVAPQPRGTHFPVGPAQGQGPAPVAPDLPPGLTGALHDVGAGLAIGALAGTVGGALVGHKVGSGHAVVGGVAGLLVGSWLGLKFGLLAAAPAVRGAVIQQDYPTSASPGLVCPMVVLRPETI